MKFEVEFQENQARYGKISEINRLANVSIETPSVMLYTRGGSVPHITNEVLKLISTDNHIIQVPLTSTIQYAEPMGEYNKPLADFVGLTEHITCVTVQDPADLTPSGKRKNNFVSIWTRSGKIDIEAIGYMKMVESFKPDIYFTLSDGDTNLASSKKRQTKAVDHTLNFFHNCIEFHQNSKILKDKTVLASIAGGYSFYERQRCINSILNCPDSNIIGGFLLDGLFNNGAEVELIKYSEIKKLVEFILEKLPNEKLKIVHGCWNPLVILELIDAGIDLFDTSYAYLITERTSALTFSFDVNQDDGKYMINLKDNFNANLFEPILNGCECLTCKNHTKAYINHLINVQEMLGGILLHIHNLHHYLKYFKTIRKCIKNNQFSNLKLLIEKQLVAYQNENEKKAAFNEEIVSYEVEGYGDALIERN